MVDRALIHALVLGSLTWYFTRDLTPTLVLAGTGYALKKVMP